MLGCHFVLKFKTDSERIQALFDITRPSSQKEFERVCDMFAYYMQSRSQLLPNGGTFVTSVKFPNWSCG